MATTYWPILILVASLVSLIGASHLDSGSVRHPSWHTARISSHRVDNSGSQSRKAEDNHIGQSIVGKTSKVECHKVALHKCGSSIIKVFKLLDFLPASQTFEAKCALRSAFFSCMKREEVKPCKKHHVYHHEEKFKKRLADTLWSTRGCILGIKSG